MRLGGFAGIRVEFSGGEAILIVMTVEEIRRLPIEEKFRIMEMIWEDLSRNEESVSSPAWHEEELKATTARVAEGEEEALDWAEAKATLRSERK